MKDAAILGVACLIAIVLGAWLFFLDTNEAQAPGAVRAVEVTVLTEGQNALVSERKNYRIRTLDELQELWSMTYTGGGPAIPGVDFERNEVLAVFDGTHSSGGYSIEVESVEDGPLSREISIVRSAPGDSCMTTSAITSPFQIVVVEKTALPIEREDRMVVTECE